MTDSNTHSDPVGATDAADTTDTTDAAASTETLGGPQGDSTRKDPEEWVTGDEPMTGAQRSYLDTLARERARSCPATSPRRRPPS